MASVVSDPNGRKRLLLVCPDGVRRPIRLGRMSKKAADAIRVMVERLASAVSSGTTPDEDVAKWLAKVDDRLHEKLVGLKLTNSRQADLRTLGAFLQAVRASKSGVKASTLLKHQQASARLIEYFGDAALLSEITERRVDEWIAWLGGLGKAATTVSKWIQIARESFHVAVRWNLVAKNPFAHVRVGSQSNPERSRFISRETIQTVIDACPDTEWRLMVALSRYGGLRCSSEHFALRWADVNWERGTITVDSPKTGLRIVPIFPDLRPYLERAFEEAEDGAEYVIARHRLASGNLRTQMVKIIRRAGLEPWPRVFHNLRASRQTELVDRFPSHVVCKWMGNSQAVAEAHYLQVNDAHLAMALKRLS